MEPSGIVPYWHVCIPLKEDFHYVMENCIYIVVLDPTVPGQVRLLNTDTEILNQLIIV